MNLLILGFGLKFIYELDKMAMYIVTDGAEYENHKTIFNALDKASTWIYNAGYNKCVLKAHK